MVEAKMTILILEEEKAEKSNYMQKFYDILPQECKKNKEEKEAGLKLKIDKSFYEITLFELSSNEKKLETIVQKAITIILVFNLDDRSSFENLGNKLIQQLKSFKFENDFYILGSSPSNQKSTCLEEVNALIQTCELQGKYFEINDYDQGAIKSFFETVFKESAESLKTKKKPDKNTVNTSCIIY